MTAKASDVQNQTPTTPAPSKLRPCPVCGQIDIVFEIRRQASLQKLRQSEHITAEDREVAQ